MKGWCSVWSILGFCWKSIKQCFNIKHYLRMQRWLNATPKISCRTSLFREKKYLPKCYKCSKHAFYALCFPPPIDFFQHSIGSLVKHYFRLAIPPSPLWFHHNKLTLAFRTHFPRQRLVILCPSIDSIVCPSPPTPIEPLLHVLHACRVWWTLPFCNISFTCFVCSVVVFFC